MAQLKRGNLAGLNTGSESRPIKHNGVIVSTSPGLNLRDGPGIGIHTRDDGRLAHADVELRTSFKEAATFPTHPRHGDVQIIPSGIHGGQSWMFVYNGNSSDTMKWEFIGGAPGHTRVAAEVTRAVADGTGYVATNCSVTMPAGITWDVHCIFGCRSLTTGGTGGSQAVFSLSHDGAAANDDWAGQSQQRDATYGDPVMTCTSSVEFTDVAASDAIVFEIKCVGLTNSVSKYTRRYLTVWPIRAKNA